MEEIYLQHHGILGMKWGIRRYQNADGTLTEAGKKRYDREVSRNHQKSKKNRVADEDLKDPNRWVEEDISRTREVVNSTRQLTGDLRNLEEVTRSKKKLERLDLSNMTDKELRDQINRELLERQYNDVFNPAEISKGREFVNDSLKVANVALTTTATALGIALAIKQLKGG